MFVRHPAQEVLQLHAGKCIDRGKRFVEQQDARLGEQAARDRRAVLSARQLLGQRIGIAGQAAERAVQSRRDRQQAAFAAAAGADQADDLARA
jgi:hypothetical protein